METDIEVECVYSGLNYPFYFHTQNSLLSPKIPSNHINRLNVQDLKIKFGSLDAGPLSWKPMN